MKEPFGFTFRREARRQARTVTFTANLFVIVIVLTIVIVMAIVGIGMDSHPINYDWLGGDVGQAF